MNEVLSEYMRGTHAREFDKCSLCKIYFQNMSLNGACGGCPMSVFSATACGCMSRKCRPVRNSPRDFDSDYNRKPELKAVIEFYEKAIAAIEKKSDAELNEEFGFDFLIEIDKKVASQYFIEFHFK